jgi:hypothetical protein
LSRSDPNAVIASSIARHVVGAQSREQLVGRLAQQLQVAFHAARDVEHDDQADRLRRVVEL